MTAPPVLMECLVEEILLRVPPDDPATLVRAALVCKPWCRLVSDPGFRRRFRALHSTPPMLGFFYVAYDDDKDEDVARFAPTTAFNPPRGIRREWEALDSRHGRVLLRTENWDGCSFLIWDPITDEKQGLPRLPIPDVQALGVAVFFAAPGNWDHLDCQRGAFNVVVVGTTDYVELFVYVYSWEANAWSQSAALHPGNDIFRTEPIGSSVLVGNALYFSQIVAGKILKYDMATREISLIDGPPVWSNFYEGRSVLMTIEDDRLGLAYMVNFKLRIWSREVGINGSAKWITRRVIELATLPLLRNLSRRARVVGSADGVGIIFIQSFDELFSMDLKSDKVRKVLKDQDNKDISDVIPFRSFYTPALDITSKEKFPNNAPKEKSPNNAGSSSE